MNGRYLTLAGRIRQEISDVVDQAKPTGANWHQELLRQMTIEIPGIRPAVLSEENKIRLMNFVASAMLCVTYIAIIWIPFASAYWSQN